jgi:putative heme iron utilization protein
MTAGYEARRFLRGQRVGMLATLSLKLGGYPFGSVTPYMLDQHGRPIVLISALAEHTKNIEHDPRVSLLANEQADDVQASTRLTLVGDAARLEDQNSPKFRYLRYFPNAAQHLELADFSFYRIEPRHIRFIGGFGAIHWVTPQDYLAPPNRLEEQEAGIVAHMNNDHAANLRDYCRYHHGLEVSDAAMLGIDCDGFDVRATGRTLRFEFNEPVVDAMGARQALVAMAQKCRG